ncbi:MAG: hypothetical protein VZS44_00400 [Bacilli bacterium]|nr:hypothetical protein [Bacilli bacterium]
MTNKKCNIHKYGPFKKNEDNYYRICLKCNKKTLYPNDKEIENEYNNQRLTDFIIDIIITKKINIIQNSNYYFKLIATLIDNISYTYLIEKRQLELLESIKELNKYYNNQDNENYILINDIVKYIEKYLTNYNNEINNKYSNKELELLDNDFNSIKNKINIELNTILSEEENTTITIEDNINETDNNININLNEAENESE